MSPLQITAFDELQADFKVPIDQGNPLHAVSSLVSFILFGLVPVNILGDLPGLFHYSLLFHVKQIASSHMLANTLRVCDFKSMCWWTLTQTAWKMMSNHRLKGINYTKQHIHHCSPSQHSNMFFSINFISPSCQQNILSLSALLPFSASNKSCYMTSG